jgi:serine/threonine-protein kinase
MGLPTPLSPHPLESLGLQDGRVVQLGHPLGRGTMATVYKGVLTAQFDLKRPVAVKVFNVVATDDHELAVSGLARAAQRMACVRHPNVVLVHDFGMEGLQAYIVSELIDGMTLRQLIDAYAVRGRRMPLDLALFIAIEIAEGLTGARLARDPDSSLQMGLTHGDLSAREVMLSWHGEVKLTDFELAIARQATSSVRTLSQLARRADTLAPEVACGLLGDARSDVFSLGILLREMLIGPRFSRDVSETEALGQARDGLVSDSWMHPHLPEGLMHVLHRSLAVEPNERYPQAGAMAYDLRRISLPLGVGDGRIFLRNALQSEREDRSDATVEHLPSGAIRAARRRSPPPPPAPGPLAPVTPFAAPLGARDDE